MEDIKTFSYISKRLSYFFRSRKNFVEVPAQSRLSILAACEDPKTISPFVFSGIKYPLPQTGQMWLEYELLKNPDVDGVYCQTTSYRDEPNPKPGRHDKIFPMFEFESKGGIEDLKNLEKELLDYLGFPETKIVDYEDMCQKYDTDEINNDLKKIEQFRDKYPEQVFKDGKFDEEALLKLKLYDACEGVCDDLLKVDYEEKSFIFYVESFGQLAAVDVLIVALEKFNEKIDAFGKALKGNNTEKVVKDVVKAAKKVTKLKK